MEAKALVLRAAGMNCDCETKFAFELAGAKADLVHINEIISKRVDLLNYNILAIPGGFTYGDDIAAGKILANEIKYKLFDIVQKFIENGNLIIGICNGFQVLVKCGLLPGFSSSQEMTLTFNDSNKFECRWTYLKTNLNSKSVFIKNLYSTIYLPVAHAEGKVIFSDDTVLEKLKNNNQIVFQYINPELPEKPAGYPYNPNGSIFDIAGICDTTGRIFGLMPHPERNIILEHHPRWKREDVIPYGIEIFKNGVEYVRTNL